MNLKRGLVTILSVGLVGTVLALAGLNATKYQLSNCTSLSDYLEGSPCASGSTGVIRTNTTYTPSPIPTLPTRPNIILIVTDDQRYDTLWAMTNLSTEVVGKGIKFNNAFVSTPLCCSSRSNILKGQHINKTNCYNNTVCAKNYNPNEALNTWLYDAGYRTGLFGKYLNGYGLAETSAEPPKWSRWVALAPDFATSTQTNNYYNYRVIVDGAPAIHPTEYSTDYFADNLVDFINASSSEPFFAYFTPYAPHTPAIPSKVDVCTSTSSISQVYTDMPCTINLMLPWRPPSYNEADVSDKPSFISQKNLTSEEQAAFSDQFHKDQLSSLLPVDRAIQRIVDTLYKNHKLNNTIIIFTSDNGLTWGEHRLFDYKPCAYDECVRVPFVMRIPGIAPRIDSTNLVENIDLAPTILDLAGVSFPTNANFDGISLKPAILGQDLLRPEVYNESLLSGTIAGGWEGDFLSIRNKDMVYTYYPFTDEEELYDLKTDPYQLTNRISEPLQTYRAAELKDKLFEFMANQGTSLSASRSGGIIRSGIVDKEIIRAAEN